ncbi:MAG: 4Fe-4S binding protein [Thermoanaerobaculia bacterium]|nr:4Fe-4S binding protein [Thermoanaerobaculia bacterium]
MATSSGSARRRVALPVVGEGAPVRRSRMGSWRAAVLVLVHLAIALHIAHWLTAGTTLSPLEPSEGMELGKRGAVNAGLLFFAAAAAATALCGRFFCGWGCHLVALQDLCQWLLRRVGIRPLPLRSRALAWVPVIAFVYMFLWPALYRLATGGAWPPLHLELVTPDFWATFPGWLVGGLTFLVCGFLIVYLLGAKGFCTYACPYGALFGAADRVAPGRIRVSDACNGCGHCTAVCTSNVRVHEEVRDFGMVVDPGCMKCLDCVSVCPNDALRFGFGRPALGATRRESAAPARPPALSGREELLLALSFAGYFFALRGLYGLFPFLLSLGLAASLAYLTLVVVRLAAARDLAVRRIQLRRGGRLTTAGGTLLGSYLLLAALALQSAAVQVALFGGAHAERPSTGWRGGGAARRRPAGLRRARTGAGEEGAGLARARGALGSRASAGARAARGLARLRRRRARAARPPGATRARRAGTGGRGVAARRTAPRAGGARGSRRRRLPALGGGCARRARGASAARSGARADGRSRAGAIGFRGRSRGLWTRRRVDVQSRARTRAHGRSRGGDRRIPPRSRARSDASPQPGEPGGVACRNRDARAEQLVSARRRHDVSVARAGPARETGGPAAWATSERRRSSGRPCGSRRSPSRQWRSPVACSRSAPGARRGRT